MIVEKIIHEMLDEAGFLSAFTDFFGDAQDAPVVQLFVLDETGSSVDGKRIICIRENGSGGGNRFVQRTNCSIFVVGLQATSDAVIIKELADQIYTHFLVTQEKCGIIEVNPLIGNSAVFYTDAGRPIVEIQTQLLIDRGIG